MRKIVLLMASTMCVIFLSNCGSGGGNSARANEAVAVYTGTMTLFQAAEDPAAFEDLKAIVASGADLDAKDEQGLTALHHAAMANNGRAVERLVRAGADASVTDAEGRTAETAAEQLGARNALRAFEKAAFNR